MSDLRKAAEMAACEVPLPEQLESVPEKARLVIEDGYGTRFIPVGRMCKEAAEALRQALAQPEQESVTLLPDGSAFGVMSFPLPDSHWLYAEREYRDGEHEPIELGKPILTHELSSAVVSAVRYAIRGATNRGKEMDFDPDALVQNAVYALCGPYTRHVDAVNISQERVDETAKREHEPVAWFIQYEYRHEFLWRKPNELEQKTALEIKPLYTAPPISDYHEGWEEGFKAATREQEPFIYVREDNEKPFGGYEHCSEADAGAFPVYTAPPKRAWVGYTNEDREKIVPMLVQSLRSHDDKTLAGLLNAILIDVEQQLKEKNNG